MYGYLALLLKGFPMEKVSIGSEQYPGRNSLVGRILPYKEIISSAILWTLFFTPRPRINAWGPRQAVYLSYGGWCLRV